MKKILFLALTTMSLFLGSCKSIKEGLYARIETSKGTMLVQLYYKETPVTVANFVTLAEGKNTYVADSLKGKKYYDGTIFHRVIKDFMLQGGDRTATGAGSPGYTFGDEIVDTLKFVGKGQLAMANAGPNTNGSQFFITQVPTTWLNGGHTIFGQVVEGIEVIDAIAGVKTLQGDRPEQNISIKSIRILREGKEAKKFDAVNVFDTYMKKPLLQKQAFVSETKTQKEQAKAFPSGIKVFTHKVGNGKKPIEGQEIGVYYAGYLTDGTLFDTNMVEVEKAYDRYDRRKEMGGGYSPMPVKYTKDMPLIAGFREALLSMNEGDKIRVFIPSNLAYGERGARVIPPNSDLIFDLEIAPINP